MLGRTWHIEEREIALDVVTQDGRFILRVVGINDRNRTSAFDDVVVRNDNPVSGHKETRA